MISWKSLARAAVSCRDRRHGSESDWLLTVAFGRAGYHRKERTMGNPCDRTHMTEARRVNRITAGPWDLRHSYGQDNRFTINPRPFGLTPPPSGVSFVSGSFTFLRANVRGGVLSRCFSLVSTAFAWLLSGCRINQREEGRRCISSDSVPRRWQAKPCASRWDSDVISLADTQAQGAGNAGRSRRVGWV